MKYFIVLITLLLAITDCFGQNNKKVEEIKKIDRQWQVESYGNRDLKEYDQIVADDFSMIGSNGTTLTKAAKRANVVADYTDPATVSADYIFKIDEASHVVRIFKNTAISNGYIIEKYTYKGNKVDSRVYFTCTYLRRNKKWQVIAAQYTRIKQS
jgi:hypothetical protein